jgi:site-specific recombinase XerD
MATTDDPNGYRQDFEAELRRLNDYVSCSARRDRCGWAASEGGEAANVALETRECPNPECPAPEDEVTIQVLDQGDADAIRTWANRLTHEYSTRATKVTYLRKLSIRAEAGGHPPLTEMDGASDFYALHDGIRDGTNPDVKDDGQAESTLRTLRSAARTFFRDALDVDWAEEINVDGPQQSKVTEDDIFVGDEVEKLFAAARNPRDKALMGALLATGQRISALLSLRLRDVDLDGQTGFIYLNDEAIGLKGAAGKRPLLWATEYVKNWMDVHPCAGDPEAALFCVTQGQDHPEREDAAEPMSTWGVNQQFRRIRDRANIDKPVNPHNFRHSAITRMVRDGVPDQQIKWMVGWKPDSGQFERYTHLKDNEMAAAMLDHYDLGADEESTIGKPRMEECPSCDAALDAWVNPVACPGCGLSLSHEAGAIEDAAEDAEEDATERGFESTDPEEIEALEAIRDAVDDPAALAEQLAALED